MRDIWIDNKKRSVQLNQRQRKRALPPSGSRIVERSTSYPVPLHIQESSASKRSSPSPLGANSERLAFRKERLSTQYHFGTREAQPSEYAPSKLTRSAFERLACREKKAKLCHRERQTEASIERVCHDRVALRRRYLRGEFVESGAGGEQRDELETENGERMESVDESSRRESSTTVVF